MDDQREGTGDEPPPPAGDPGIAGEVPPAAPPAPPADHWLRPPDWGPASRNLPPPRGTIRIGSVIVRSFDLFVRRIEVFLALSLPALFLSLLSSILSGARGPQTAASVALLLPVTLIAVVVGLAFGLALVMAADDTRAGRPVELGSTIRRGFARTVPAVLSAIAIFLVLLGVVLGGGILVALLAVTRSVPLVAIGAIVLIGAVLYLLLRWSLANAAIALEPLGPVEAIGRSRAVTRGNLWRLFALFLILGLVTLPLGIAIGLLSITQADLVPATVLSIAAGLITAPLFAIVTTTVFGDLTGRPEELIAPRSQWLLAVVAGVILVVGLVAVVDAVPKVGPAIERIALQAIPVEDRGKIVAGTILNPLDPCRPTGAKVFFDSGDSIYVGGYFTKPIPRGQMGMVDIQVNGRNVASEPLSNPLQSVVCYYELTPIVEASPGTYRIVVSLDGETIAEGAFTVE